MLTQLRISDLKAIDNATVPIGRLTILIGPNNSGKSTCLHALAFMAQVFDDPAMLNFAIGPGHGPTFTDLVRIGSGGQRFHVGLSARPDRSFKALNWEDVVVETDVTFERDGWSEFEFTVLEEANARIEARFNKRDRNDRTVRLTEVEQLGFVDLQVAASWVHPLNVTPRTNAPSESDKAKERELSDIAGIFAAELRGHLYAPAYRGEVRRSFTLAASSVHLPPDLASTVSSYMQLGRPQQDMLERWTQRITGIQVMPRLIDDPSQRDPTVTASTSIDQSHVDLQNLGSGTVQLLQLLYPLVRAEEGALISLEEPEAHLHPSAQYEIVRVINEVCGEKNLQVVMTTHSEHILFAALGLVSAGEINSDAIQVSSFVRDGSVASCTAHKVDENGRLSGGLEQFFEAGMGSLAHLSADSG